MPSSFQVSPASSSPSSFLLPKWEASAMSGGDRSCRHPVNKLFIFPQPCLPNRDEFFHTNRNKTARTHTHKIVRGQKNIWRLKSDSIYFSHPSCLLDQPSCQLVNSSQYSTTLSMILSYGIASDYFPFQTAALTTCNHQRSGLVSLKFAIAPAMLPLT